MAERDDDDGQGLTAPYTAFSSIKTAAKSMAEHGIPSRIDRSVLTNFSGSVASQVMQAFKFLKLTTDSGEPTVALRSLVTAAAANDEAKWANALAPVVKAAYAPMFSLNLETASPSQFGQHFRKTYPGTENVSRKSLTFFVNALTDAKIPVSAYIIKNKKARSAPTVRKPRASAGASGAGGNGNGSAPKNLDRPNPPPLQPTSAYDVLMKEIYDPNKMKPNSEEEKAVFVLARYLKIKELAG